MVEDPFRTSVSADGRVLSVFGVLDELSVDDFRTALHQALSDSPEALTVDLSNVCFLPSLAIGVLVGALKTGAPIQLVASDGCIAARVLGITGLPYSEAHPPAALT
jgi:anti-anti-sigma factor